VPRLSKPRTTHNSTRRPTNTTRALATVLDVLGRVDRRHAMRLMDAIAALVLFATKKPRGAKRTVKP
jgi:hypothetical protein